jgi:hypothetical protein
LLQASVPKAKILLSPEHELQNASPAVEENEGQKRRQHEGRKRRRTGNGDSSNVGDVGQRPRSALKAPKRTTHTRTREIKPPSRAPGDELQ